MEDKKEFMYKWQLIGLVILVAIPLPGTGAWTGALVAALMDIRLKRRVPGYCPGRCNRRAFGDGDNVRVYRNFCIMFFFLAIARLLHRIAQEG